MLTVKYAALFTLLTFFTSAFAQQKVEDKAFAKELEQLLSHSVPEITVEDAADLEQVQFLDSRKLEEYDVSHINQALWVGFNEFSVEKLSHLNKKNPVVVYCSVGYRSEKIAEKLQEAGFTNVYNLYGGIFEWVHTGNLVYNASGETEKVHTFNKKWSEWLKAGEKVY